MICNIKFLQCNINVFLTLKIQSFTEKSYIITAKFVICLISKIINPTKASSPTQALKVNVSSTTCFSLMSFSE